MSKKVGDFTFTTGGSPPELVRTSKYDAVRDQVLANGEAFKRGELPSEWTQVAGGDADINVQAQTLKARYGDVIEVLTRNGELWARPIPAPTKAPRTTKST